MLFQKANKNLQNQLAKKTQMVKLKMGIDIGYATDFGAGNAASNNRSGFEIFAKYRF